MRTNATQSLHSARNGTVVTAAAILGLIGYLVNCIPIEVFPGVSLAFGSVVAMAAAMKYGRWAGGVAGGIAGLRTYVLFGQPLFVGPIVYGLEAVSVGYLTRTGKSGPGVAAALYWVFFGGWLSLTAQYVFVRQSFRTAMSFQARSVINGILAGVVVEAAIVLIEVIRRRPRAGRQPADPDWRRQQELLLEATAAKTMLEASFDAMTDGMVITDLDDRLVQANPAYFRLRNLEPEHAVGRILSDLSHPNGDWRSCKSCRARREGIHTILLRTPDETCFDRYLEVRVDPVFDSKGHRTGSVEVLCDLTGKHRAEAEAERAGALLRELVDAAQDGVYAAYPDGRLLWGNGRAAFLLGREAPALEGESCMSSVAPGDLERSRDAFARAASGEAQRLETQFIARDRTTRTVLVTYSPIFAKGEITRVLGILRDLTDERDAAEQSMRSDKLRALGQLAWGVAHNFNNSLTAVLGYTQLALGKTADPALVRNLKTVEQAAIDAAKMVQRIQNFARQSKDEVFVPVDTNQIVRDALDLTRARWKDDAGAAGIVYEMSFKPEGEAVALCDQSAIREVFVNIIMNAIEAMPNGGRVSITSAIEQDDVLITFADTGTGMTPETRHRIFEPFYTTKGAKGQGMGLAVCYGTIERHGGTIAVTSEPGRGTTLTIKLRCAPGLEPDSRTRPELPASRSLSVLVVDDEAPIRVLLSDVLQARGHTVKTAQDGLDGLKAIESERFDIVVTDLSMPGADGWTLARAARNRWPDTKLVMLTGYGSSADQAVPGGDNRVVDLVLSKPFNLAEIDLALSQLFGDH